MVRPDFLPCQSVYGVRRAVIRANVRDRTAICDKYLKKFHQFNQKRPRAPATTPAAPASKTTKPYLRRGINGPRRLKAPFECPREGVEAQQAPLGFDSAVIYQHGAFTIVVEGSRGRLEFLRLFIALRKIPHLFPGIDINGVENCIAGHKVDGAVASAGRVEGRAGPDHLAFKKRGGRLEKVQQLNRITN